MQEAAKRLAEYQREEAERYAAGHNLGTVASIGRAKEA